MSNTLLRLKRARRENSSANETIASIVELRGNKFLFTVNRGHEDIVWFVREVMMLLKQSGFSRVTTRQIKFGPKPYSILFDPDS